MRKYFFLFLLLPCLSCVKSSDVQICVTRDTSYTGRGNSSEKLLDLAVRSETGCRIKSVDVVLVSGEDDISALKLVSGGETISKSVVRRGKNRYRMHCGALVKYKEVISVCADIRMTADEGDCVSADIAAVNTTGASISPEMPHAGGREILLCRKCLYRPGDFGSEFWRIPAIRQLSDGTLLAVNDRRNDTEFDLPESIDVVFRYSTDNGHNWSEPGYIARNQGKMHGFGDPSLVETEDGTVICFFTGGERFMRSTEENAQRSYYAESKDFGRSWSEPKEITRFLWGENAGNPDCRKYHSSFTTSGNDLLLTQGEHKGRILAATVMADGKTWNLSNHAVYSDDGGKTWNVSDVAFDGRADEAKLVELKDGRVIMTTRRHGPKPYVVSEDGGRSWSGTRYWDNLHVFNCNGDIIRHGDILMLSAPANGTWRDVGIFLSFDEGGTWPVHKVLSPGPSMYSSITVLKDNTVGIYFETKTSSNELWYENVSLDWLMKATAPVCPTGVRLWDGGPEWAEFNLGASAPEDAGDYFSWGETDSKKSFGWTKYKFCSGGSDNLTKYCTSSQFGTVDGNTDLDSCDDAASTAWGEGWRVPTKAEMEELKQRCKWTWTSLNGAKGYCVTGENGPSIFLPAAGYYTGSVFKEYGDFGYYWTADIDSELPYMAWDFYFQSEHAGCFSGGRDNGRSIRPVRN